MKITNFLFGVLVLLITPNCTSKNTVKVNGSVFVKINYGADKQTRKAELKWENGMTVLTALLHTAKVETHTVGPYVFVTSIDSVNGVRGIKAWYYNVNGKHPKVLAINNLIFPGDTILWLFTKDVCSGKVDSCKNNTR